jgi:hypothetical protein
VRVEVEALANPEADNGWTVLATPVSPEVRTDAEMLQACQGQRMTAEPGCRWSKNPAAIAPVWLEKPERIAALAILTVVGFWSTASSRDRSVSSCARMSSSSQVTRMGPPLVKRHTAPESGFFVFFRLGMSGVVSSRSRVLT